MRHISELLKQKKEILESIHEKQQEIEEIKFHRMNWVDAFVYSFVDAIKFALYLFFLLVFLKSCGLLFVEHLPEICSLIK